MFKDRSAHCLFRGAAEVSCQLSGGNLQKLQSHATVKHRKENKKTTAKGLSLSHEDLSGGSKGGMKVVGKDPSYILYQLYWGLFPIPHLPSSHLLSPLIVESPNPKP